IHDATTLCLRPRYRSRTDCASRADVDAASSRSNAATCAATESVDGRSDIGERREDRGLGGYDSRQSQVASRSVAPKSPSSLVPVLSCAGVALLARALGLLRDRGERGGAADGELGEALAIERDAGALEAVNQLPVGEPVLARRGIDADDPQPAEIALLPAAADEGVLQRGIDRLLCSPIELALVGVVALRQPQQLLPLGAADRSSFYTRHLCLQRPR